MTHGGLQRTDVKRLLATPFTLINVDLNSLSLQLNTCRKANSSQPDSADKVSNSTVLSYRPVSLSDNKKSIAQPV